MLNCQHLETRTHKWVENDGTLMFHKSCLQCGETLDKGHVYGEDDGKWSGVFIEKSAQQSVQRTAGTWRKFLNLVGRVAGSFRRR